MVSDFTRYSCIPCMLLFGTATVTLQKFIFNMSSEGRDAFGNPEVHTFNKPWFQTEAMFAGMFLCLLVFEISRLLNKCKPKSDVKETLVDAEANAAAAAEAKNHWMNYVYVGAPAMCDLCATCLMNIGLFYISASIWQMLRGSMIIFSAIVSMIFLKKKFHAYQWTGIATVIVGLIIVGASSFMEVPKPTVTPTIAPNATALFSLTAEPEEPTTGNVVMAICLVVFAQVIQASQIVIEEYFLRNLKNASSSLIVGLEGFWGGLVGALILVGISFTSTENALVAKVFHEDTIDTFLMIGNSNPLLVLVIFYIACILGYNLFGMMVTETYSAVYRTIIEALRTVCIWICNIIIYYAYAVPTQQYQFGEPIWWNSLVELFGFAFCMTGTFIYNKVLKFKAFEYPEN
ncbi:hypothetical protein WA158_006225 [Blastocystis sp. Blastoise]